MPSHLKFWLDCIFLSRTNGNDCNAQPTIREQRQNFVRISREDHKCCVCNVEMVVATKHPLCPVARLQFGVISSFLVSAIFHITDGQCENTDLPMIAQ